MYELTLREKLLHFIILVMKNNTNNTMNISNKYQPIHHPTIVLMLALGTVPLFLYFDISDAN